jgi:hypothetical protein
MLLLTLPKEQNHLNLNGLNQNHVRDKKVGIRSDDGAVNITPFDISMFNLAIGDYQKYISKHCNINLKV